MITVFYFYYYLYDTLYYIVFITKPREYYHVTAIV